MGRGWTRGAAAILISAALSSAAVWAQAPLESVTVTGTRPRTDAINDYLFSHATPTRMTDKVARWFTGICPQTYGLGAKYAQHVSQRIRAIAQSVGAPVNRDAACRANIQIIFTTTPQALLDNIRKDHSVFLGYHDNSEQKARLATFSRPIQSWYTTATSDLDGIAQVDSAHSGGITVELPSPPPTGPGGMEGFAGGKFTLNLPSASAKRTTGSRLGDGLVSGFYNVIIIAEPGKLGDFEVGTLADYIAMLALSQPGPLEECDMLPTITNMLATGCSNGVRTITDGDLAYLRGLYRMSPAGTLQMQRSQIGYEMKKTLQPD